MLNKYGSASKLGLYSNNSKGITGELEMLASRQVQHYNLEGCTMQTDSAQLDGTERNENLTQSKHSVQRRCTYDYRE